MFFWGLSIKDVTILLVFLPLTLFPGARLKNSWEFTNLLSFNPRRDLVRPSVKNPADTHHFLVQKVYWGQTGSDIIWLLCQTSNYCASDAETNWSKICWGSFFFWFMCSPIERLVSMAMNQPPRGRLAVDLVHMVELEPDERLSLSSCTSFNVLVCVATLSFSHREATN